MAAPTLLRLECQDQAASLGPPHELDFWLFGALPIRHLRQRRHLHPLAQSTGGGSALGQGSHNPLNTQGIGGTLHSFCFPP